MRVTALYTFTLQTIKERCHSAHWLEIDDLETDIHIPQVTQIGLVTDEHDDDVLVGVIAEFAQPPFHIFVCEVFGNVVDEQSSDSTPVIRRGDGAVPFLTGRIPYLRFNNLIVDLK